MSYISYARYVRLSMFRMSVTAGHFPDDRSGAGSRKLMKHRDSPPAFPNSGSRANLIVAQAGSAALRSAEAGRRVDLR
jgi:hypothetical protein